MRGWLDGKETMIYNLPSLLNNEEEEFKSGENQKEIEWIESLSTLLDETQNSSSSSSTLFVENIQTTWKYCLIFMNFSMSILFPNSDHQRMHHRNHLDHLASCSIGGLLETLFPSSDDDFLNPSSLNLVRHWVHALNESTNITSSEFLTKIPILPKLKFLLFLFSYLVLIFTYFL